MCMSSRMVLINIIHKWQCTGPVVFWSRKCWHHYPLMLFWGEQQCELLQGVIKSWLGWSKHTLSNLWLTNILVPEPKFQYCLCGSLQLDMILTQSQLLKSSHPASLRFNSVLSSHLFLGLPSDIFQEVLLHTVLKLVPFHFHNSCYQPYHFCKFCCKPFPAVSSSAPIIIAFISSDNQNKHTFKMDFILGQR